MVHPEPSSDTVKVVVDREHKIVFAGEWDGEWDLVHAGEVVSLIHQDGRGYRLVATSVLRSLP